MWLDCVPYRESVYCVFLFKPKTAYEMRISDWSSDVCSSDLSRYRPGSSVASCAAAKVRAVFDDRILRAWPRSGAGATPTATSSPPSDRNCQVDRKSTRLNSSH